MAKEMGLDRAPIEFQTFYFSHVLLVLTLFFTPNSHCYLRRIQKWGKSWPCHNWNKWLICQILPNYPTGIWSFKSVPTFIVNFSTKVTGFEIRKTKDIETDAMLIWFFMPNIKSSLAEVWILNTSIDWEQACDRFWQILWNIVATFSKVDTYFTSKFQLFVMFCSSFFCPPIFQLKIWIGGDKEMGWWSLEEGSCLQILREVELPHANLVRGISSFWKEWLWVRRQAKLRALACHLLIMEPARLSNRKLFASPRPHISKLLLLCWGTEGIAGVWLLAGRWLLSSNQKNVYDQLEWSLVSHPPVCDTFFDLIKLWGKGRGGRRGHWGGNVTRWNMPFGLQSGGGQNIS